jgi:DNA-binding CsgD family transcriptional regulator
VDDVRVIGMVEAAYQLDGDETEWLRGLVTALLPSFDHGFGAYAYTFDLNDPDRPVSLPVAVGPEWLPQLVYNLNMSAPPALLATLHTGRPYATVSEQLSQSRDPQVREASKRTLVAYEGNEPRPIAEAIWDSIGMVAGNPDGTGVVVSAPLPRPIRITPRDRVRFGRIAAHVAAALRLRRALAAGEGLEEAILAPDGACVHAEGAATPRSAREDLRRAARAIDRARATPTGDPDEALGIWRALCAGRWTLLDRFESDGRRLLVARENSPSVPDPRALTLRERQVLAFAALGHTNKLVAYSLGISPSVVAAHLNSAMKKLGLRSRVELVETFARLGLGTDDDHTQDT